MIHAANPAPAPAPAPHTASTELDAPLLQRLGVLTHNLYRYAHTEGIRSFDALLFKLLQDALAFDSAWIGHSTLTPAGPVMHSNVLHQLTPDYAACWEAVQAHDPLVHEAIGQPGMPTLLTVDDVHLHPEFRAFLQQFGIGKVLCTTNLDPTLQTCVHLSLYRHAAQPAFTQSERALMAAAMPNLASAIAMNRMREVERVHAGSTAPRTGVAIVSNKGLVQYADAAFGDFMLNEWPDWPGALLPTPLLQALASDTAHFNGTRNSVVGQTRGDLLIVTARRKPRSDNLTPRERAVALQFAQGNSYKEVARTQGMAPSTVRHHLRQVYAKLNIQDKGAIAWALAQELS